MKTNVIFAMAFLLAMPICAQVTYESNNPIFGTPLGYIGWYGSAPLDFRTDDIIRMRLMEHGATVIDNYTINHDGFVGLSTDPSYFSLVKPFSLLHLSGLNNGVLGPQQ